MTITDLGHVEAAARLRKEFQQPRTKAGVVAGDDVFRDLSDYARAFGLIEGIS